MYGIQGGKSNRAGAGRADSGGAKLGLTKNWCGAAGCSLLGLAKNVRDTASVAGGPSLGPPSTSSVTHDNNNIRQLTLTARLGGGDSWRLCVWNRRPGRNARATVVGQQRQLNSADWRSARQEPRPPKGDFAGTTEHQLGDARQQQHPSAYANGSPWGGGSWRLCVWQRRPGRNARATVVGQQRHVSADS